MFICQRSLSENDRQLVSRLASGFNGRQKAGYVTGDHEPGTDSDLLNLELQLDLIRHLSNIHRTLNTTTAAETRYGKGRRVNYNNYNYYS